MLPAMRLPRGQQSPLVLKIAGGGAIEVAQNSRQRNGLSFDAFIREHGVPEAEMHRRYHEEISLDFLKPDHRLAHGFRQANANHVILTHGSTDWAKRVLAARQLSGHFKDGHIIGLEQVNFVKKSDGAQPFEHVLALTGHQPSEALMVEDTAKNLKHPKAMGMQTVFISYGKGDGDGHADHIFDSAQDFLEAYGRQVAVEPKVWRR